MLRLRLVICCVSTAVLMVGGCSGSQASRSAEGVSASAISVGSTGPGGGVVFFDAGSQQPWGRYLEAAPRGWSAGSYDPKSQWEDPKSQWCPEGKSGFATRLATRTDIGAGAGNTALIIANCGADSAAGIAAAYRGGGKADWYLPSIEELLLLYRQREAVGGVIDDFFFWSSSQGFDPTKADVKYFNEGDEFTDSKSGVHHVRPIRAF